jgi:hypothetical protein
MRIQTILNRVEKFKSFVYGEASFEVHDDGPALVVRMETRTHERTARSLEGRVTGDGRGMAGVRPFRFLAPQQNLWVHERTTDRP